ADALLTGLGLLVIAAVCLNFANVVGRYVFGQAIFGADEIQTYMMVWMAFLGAVIVGWRNAHLRMDVLVRALPPWLKVALRILELTLLAATTVLVAIQSWKFVIKMAELDRRSDAADIPMAIPHAAVAIGFTLIAAGALWHLVTRRWNTPASDQDPT
ncbi:MAG: TRAP transporter small permease, partial [Betaproteobacteria bacterium]